MANEDKKDFNTMLQCCTIIRICQNFRQLQTRKALKNNEKILYSKVITVGKIREYFAELGGADFTEPITAGIFVSIVAWASYQRSEDETSYGEH